jgi:hypothetical protein
MNLSDIEIKNAYSISKKDHGLIQLAFLKNILDSDDDLRMAEFIKSDALKIIHESPDKTFDLMIDLTALGTNHRISRKARQVYVEILNLPQCGRLAFIGSNIFLKVMINFLIKAGGVDKRSKMFNNKEVAKKWLNQ